MGILQWDYNLLHGVCTHNIYICIYIRMLTCTFNDVMYDRYDVILTGNGDPHAGESPFRVQLLQICCDN